MGQVQTRYPESRPSPRIFEVSAEARRREIYREQETLVDEIYGLLEQITGQPGFHQSMVAEVKVCRNGFNTDDITILEKYLINLKKLHHELQEKVGAQKLPDQTRDRSISNDGGKQASSAEAAIPEDLKKEAATVLTRIEAALNNGTVTVSDKNNLEGFRDVIKENLKKQLVAYLTGDIADTKEYLDSLAITVPLVELPAREPLTEGPLVLRTEQRIDLPVDLESLEEIVDFSSEKSRQKYFDDLGKRVINLRESATLYFVRFQSADVPWPAYNKIGLQKTALAEAFFKGSFSQHFWRLDSIIKNNVSRDPADQIDPQPYVSALNRSYEIVEDQIKAVNQALVEAMADPTRVVTLAKVSPEATVEPGVIGGTLGVAEAIIDVSPDSYEALYTVLIERWDKINQDINRYQFPIDKNEAYRELSARISLLSRAGIHHDSDQGVAELMKEKYTQQVTLLLPLVDTLEQELATFTTDQVTDPVVPAELSPFNTLVTQSAGRFEPVAEGFARTADNRLELGQEAFVVAKRAYIASRIKLAQLQKVAKTITRDATEFPALLSAATEAVAISRAAYDRALAEIQSVNPNFARDDDTSSGVVNEMPNPLNRLRKLTRLLVLAGALVYPSSLDTAKNNDHISVASVTTGNSADWFKQNITPLSAPALATENGGVESVPGVVLRNPVLSDEGAANPPFSQGAENIPTDPNITLPDMSLDPDTSLLATTVPQPNQVTLSSAESVSARPPQEGVTPQLTETEKTATTFAPVMSDLIEVRPVIDHVVVPGDNVTKLLKRYGTKQLAGLSDAEANTAIAKVIAKISATLELQEASGVGKNPDLIIASVSRPQVLHLTPLVAELEKIVHAEAMTQSPVSPQAEAEVVVPRTTVEATEAINATVVPSETATLAVSRESISPVRSVESEIMAYKASYPGGQKGLADFYDTQVEAIQGKHPKAYSGIFSIFSAGTEHTDAYNILKAMSVRAVRELSNLPISARLSRLGELALLPEDLAKWETQLRRWQMIPDLNQLDDSIPFGALAERAFVLEQINRPVTTIV